MWGGGGPDTGAHCHEPAPELPGLPRGHLGGRTAVTGERPTPQSFSSDGQKCPLGGGNANPVPRTRVEACRPGVMQGRKKSPGGPGSHRGGGLGMHGSQVSPRGKGIWGAHARIRGTQAVTRRSCPHKPVTQGQHVYRWGNDRSHNRTLRCNSEKQATNVATPTNVPGATRTKEALVTSRSA